MFEKLIKNNYGKQLKLSAIPYITIQRNTYIDIYNYILNFIDKKSLLVSDIDLLLDQHKYWENIQIYSIDADATAKELIKELCANFDNNFVLKIVENKQMYTIEYNLCKLCDIITLALYRKYSITDFIDPTKYKVNDVTTIQLLPPLLEVINLYSDLYKPSMAENWSDILVNIQYLETLIETATQKILLGKTDINLDITESLLYYDTNMINSPKRIKKTVNVNKYILDFISDTNYLLLDHTVNIFDKVDDISINTIDVIDIISQNSIEFDFNALSTYLSNVSPLGLEYKIKDMYIIKEPNMTKHMVYVTYKDGVNKIYKHVLNIYNNLSYELVNYNIVENKLGIFKVVDAITQIRFIYIIIWNRLITQKTHNYALVDFKKFLVTKLKYLEKYKEKIDIVNIKKNYTGIYLDTNILRKKKALLREQISKMQYYCFDVIN